MKKIEPSQELLSEEELEGLKAIPEKGLAGSHIDTPKLRAEAIKDLLYYIKINNAVCLDINEDRANLTLENRTLQAKHDTLREAVGEYIKAERVWTKTATSFHDKDTTGQKETDEYKLHRKRYFDAERKLIAICEGE